MPQLRGTVNGARGLRRATLANPRRRAVLASLARARLALRWLRASRRLSVDAVGGLARAM